MTTAQTRTATMQCSDGAHDRCGGWIVHQPYGAVHSPPTRCDCDCGHLPAGPCAECGDQGLADDGTCVDCGYPWTEADPETAPHDYGACDDCGGSYPQDDLTAIAGKRLCVTCADRFGR